jgi:hypothetical protein
MAQTLGEGMVMSKPHPPIFAVEGLDVAVYSSLEDALLHLEPIDVANRINLVYDAKGRLLHLSTDGKRNTAQLAEQEPLHANELAAALRAFLGAVGDAAAADPLCDLACLVEASKKFTYSPPRPWPLDR